MALVKIPEGAETAYRLKIEPSFAAPLEMKVFGSQKWGWFHVTCRNPLPNTMDIANRRLRKGQWRTLRNFLQQCRFWSLPCILNTGMVTDDGSVVVLEGQEREREHWITRHGPMEPGLARAINYFLEVSTIFPDGSPWLEHYLQWFLRPTRQIIEPTKAQPPTE